MRNFSNPKIVLELIKSGNRDLFINNEIEVAHYLSECFDSHDPLILDLCFYLSRFEISEGKAFVFTEVANMLMEEYLDADTRTEDVLAFLEEDLPQRICSPLWHLLARGSYRFSSDFKYSLIRFFKHDPCFFAEVIERTQDTYYIPTVESMLQKVAPYVKYMPLFENSHEVFTEHDFWLRGGNSFIRLREMEGSKTHVQPMDYLETVFLNVLPDDLDEWLLLNTKEDGVAFKKRHKEFINLCLEVEEE